MNLFYQKNFNDLSIELDNLYHYLYENDGHLSVLYIICIYIYLIKILILISLILRLSYIQSKGPMY
jgi:hypothetical protein